MGFSSYTPFWIVCFLVMLLFGLQAVKDDKLCRSKEKNPYVYFSTYTPYVVMQNKNDDAVRYSGCLEKQMWMMVRHGTRYPGRKKTEKMMKLLSPLQASIIENHKRGKGYLCKTDLNHLQKWKLKADMLQEKNLAHQGEEEMLELAERFQNRFPHLLNMRYHPALFQFRLTDSQRTLESARYFATGMFGRGEAKDVEYPTPLENDPLIRFYKNCSRWQVEVDDNPEAYRERTKFQEGPEMKDTIRRVSINLGFSNTLTLDDLEVMYYMCNFDKAWQPQKVSPWCVAFSTQDLKIMEYREDLEYYWVDGYGYEINHKQACPATKDILNHFRAMAKRDEEEPNGIFYFTHSGTILKVFTHLGLFQDSSPLRHDNFQQQGQRKWRTSFIDPFGSNIAMVLFQCENNEYKVVTYVQEKPVIPRGCTEELCPFESLLKEFSKEADSCDIEATCKVDKPPTGG